MRREVKAPEGFCEEDFIASFADRPKATPTKMSEHSLFAESAAKTKQSEQGENTTQRRTSTKQRKVDFNEYQKLFLHTPKIADRKTTYLSKELWNKLHKIARTLGDDRMSVTGFVENLVRHHIETYGDDIERWKRL